MAVLVVAVIALTAPDGSNKQSGSGSSPASRNSQAQPAPASPSASSPSSTPSMTAPRGSLSLGGRSSGRSSTGSDSGAAKDVPLVVLNNTTTSGLASDAARDFRDGGWDVTSVGNLQNNILSTCAYYDPDVAGAKAAATALNDQFAGIKRVARKFADLPSGPIVVVLTSDYSSN